MADINDRKKEYIDSLKQIVPYTNIQSMEQVRDPKTLEWCIGQLESGKSMDELKALLGLLDVRKRYLWRRIKAKIEAHHMPATEIEALTEYYVKQEERIEHLEETIRDLDQRIAAGPNDRVATNGRGEEFVVEDKGFNSLLEYRIKAVKMLADEEEKRMKWFLDQKKTKLGVGKYQGATIHIHSNVPRPTMKDAEKLLGDEDE